MYDIICSIVVYKEPIEKLKANIIQVLKSKLNIKVVIIDNSPDDRLRELKKATDIEYIFNNKNLGYGKAHNIAIKKYTDQAKYLLVMNPDIFVKDGTLEKLFNYMESKPDVGLVMPNVVSPDGQRQYLCKLLPTPINLILRRAFNYKSKRYEMRSKDYSKEIESPSLSGCFMFVKSKVLKNIGGFDERFFMYLEDLDFSRRINAVCKTMFYPNAEIIHEHKKASYKNLKMLLAHCVSAIRYFNKWGWLFDKERRKINGI